MPPILVDQGLINSRDSSATPDGAVTRADDSYYRINDGALWKTKGRAAFNSAAESGSIKGLRGLLFDGAADILVAHVGTTYRYATPLATTGSFANLVTGLTGGTTMDATHYNNQHILTNGVDRGQVISSDATAILLGMLINTTVPTISRDAGAGTGFTLVSGTTVTYWVEERAKSGTTIVKRSASATTTTATLTGDGTLDKPVITRPAIVNSDATHWALFATATGGTFPVGGEIAEVAIGTTTIEDTRVDSPAGTVAIPTPAYETVVASISGVVTQVPKHGAPPIIASADVMEDSIVAFDAADKSLLKYTYPDNIHAWPLLNIIRFETKEEDEGIAFRYVGQVGIALFRDSVWRVQTLPRPEDSAFQTGRVKSQVDGALGIVGSQACDILSFGQGARLAYISPAALIVTDGYEWDTVSDDLDWPATFDVTQLAGAILVNNPSEYRLEMTAVLSDGTTGEYWFHYHKSHRNESKFKITGPIHRPATAKARAFLNGQRRIFAGASDGKAYLTDSGNSEPLGTLAQVVRTKDYYPAGIGDKATLRRFYIHHSASAGQTASSRLVLRNPKQADTSFTDSIDLTYREATPVYRQADSEALQFGFENSDALGQTSVDYFQPDFVLPTPAKGK